MKATSAPYRLRLRRLRIAAGIASALAMLGYLIHTLHGRQLFMQFGNIVLRTGEYNWSWFPGTQLVMRIVGALGFIGLATWRGRRGGGGSDWARLAAGAATLTLCTNLVAEQILGTLTLVPLFQWTLLTLSLVAAWLLLRPGEPRPLAERLGAWLARGGRGWMLAAAVAGAGVMIYSWRVIFDAQPLVTDTQSQIAQARLMLSGHWRLEVSQALTDVICFPYATHRAPIFSQYPPGYILPLMGVLAARLPAQLLDLPTAALTAALTVALARRVAGRATAAPAALLLIGSPFFMGLTGSGMNHSLAAALLTAAALCLVPAGPVRRAPARSALLAGFCLGWVVMTRPVTGLGHMMIWGAVWAALLWTAWRRGAATMRPDRTPAALVRQLLAAGAGAAVPAAIFLYYNYRTTGNPLVMGYQISNPELHRLGFHGGALAFTPVMAGVRVVANFVSLNFQLFGWVIGSWVALALWLGRTRLARGERVVAALILTQAGLYAIYQFHDLFLGPRFLYEILPGFVVLAAAGLAPALRRRDWRAGLLGVVLALLALGGLAEGSSFWEMKFNPITPKHSHLEAFLCGHEPFHEPTVVVLPKEETGEMIGRHFEWGKVWFVVKSNEAQARKLPELAGWKWIEYKPEY